MAQDFLAVAQIQIAANTKLFQDQLAALLAETAAIKPIAIPIVATGGASAATINSEIAASSDAAAAGQAKVAASTNVATAALENEAAAAATAGVANQRLVSSATSSAAVNRALIAVENAVAKAKLAVVGAASAEEAAEIQVARKAAAGAAAREALTQAQLAGIKTEELLARTSVATAVAYGEQAAAAEAAAAKTAASAVASREAAKGLQAQSLSAVGLRGAIIGANPAFLAATASAILFGKAVKVAADLQVQLNVFRVTAGATADEMQRVSETAQQLGRDVSLPAVSASDAAQAMTELAKAGLSVQDSIAGARGVLQLAAAAQIDNAQATELAASALNAFGLAGDQTVHVADVLANAANAAQGSISDIGLALGQAAAVGRQAGLSLEQVAGVLTVFARNGLKGSDSGTAFRTAILRLINPTDKAAKIIHDLGLSIRTASGAVDLTVFDQFTQATKNFTAAERDRDLAIIFGQDAVRGASILAREGASALDQQTEALNKSGTAAEVAAARMSGLSGQTSALSSNLETLAISLGKVVNPGLTGLAHGLNIVVSGLNTGVGALTDFLNKADFDAANAHLGDFVNRLVELQGNIDDFKSGGSFIPPTLIADSADVQKQLTALGKSFVALGPQGVQKFVAAFTSASPQIKAAMQDNVITPLEKAQLSSTALGRAFVASLPKTAFTGLGATVRSGIEDATASAKVAVADTGAEIRSGIEDASRAAGVAATHLGTNVGNNLKSSLTAAFLGAVVAANTGAQRLTDALNQATISGAGPQATISILQTGFAAAQKRVDAANTRLAELEGQGDSPAVKRARAKAKAQRSQGLQEQASITDQIKAQNDQITATAQQAAADRTAAAKKVQDANTKADQAVIDAFAPKQNKLDLRAVTAGQSENLKAQLALQVAIANEASREIAVIDKTVKDKQTRDKEIAARVKTLAESGANITGLLAQIAQKAKDRAAAIRQAATDVIGLKLQLAQARGAKDPILAAFDAAIADAKKRVAAAKRGSAAQLQEQLALQNFINDRKDFLTNLQKQAGDLSSQGITAFDLLKQAASVFNQNAGNLINAQQPFVGPSGFSADIAQFLIRRPQSTPGSQNLGSPQEVKLSDDLLIRALDRLTDAVSGAGNSSTATTVKATVGNPWAGRRWFMDANSAKNAQEG